MKDFVNEVYYNFNDQAIASKQREAINNVQSLFGKEYPNIINGERIYTDNKTTSINPSNTDQIVGVFQKSGKEDAEKAMQSALSTFETWKKVPPSERAEYLFKAADVMRRRRLEINAWMISEVGKNYLEADADTCEAIDFLDFYGREMLRYAAPQPIIPDPAGEKNEMIYIPLGVGVVIPPWNFPFAILAGMTAAAFVAGNTVVLKPSSDSPMMGWLFMEILEEVGLPKGVVNFLVASGAEAGDYLVTHPKTRFVSFTGSMEVGLRINELAAKTVPGQIWIKRIVAEMGGKDSMVIDSDCNLDAAAQAVVAAAYGFQGQKCSACSRAIVVASVYDEFINKVKAIVDTIEVGNAADDKRMGPVVSKKAMSSILEYIEIGKKEGRLIAGGGAVEGLNGYYIKPTVIADIAPMARISQEEIFGPVLAIIKADDFNHGLEIANNTIYGLTGAVFTNDKAKLQKTREEFMVGNLYLNRKCTGALVGVNPFGGFNMSGTDSKAGGRDYLLLFLQAKSISEKAIS